MDPNNLQQPQPAPVVISPDPSDIPAPPNEVVPQTLHGAPLDASDATQSGQLTNQPFNPPVPTSESPKKGSPLIIIAIILVVIAVLAVVAYIFGAKFFTPQPTPTPTPIVVITPSPTPDVTASWKTINMQGCSTRYKDFGYSMKASDGWVSSKTQDDENGTTYKLTEGQNASIEIDCTDGIGAVICVNGTDDWPFQIANTPQNGNGCYWTSNLNTGKPIAEYNLKNPDEFGYGWIVFSVRGVVDKTLLDQMFSTFQFTGATPSATQQ